MQSYGVAAAAQAYFNKSLDELTLAEAAFLAALPKAPNNYNPFRFPDAARARRDWVLDRMAEDHVITAEQAAAAKATPITPAEFHRPETVAGADYFAEEVRRQLVDRFGADVTTQGGLVVRTSLDPALQAYADKALHDGLLTYDRAHGGWRGPVTHLDATPGIARGLGHLARASSPTRPACCRNGASPSCSTAPTPRRIWACWITPPAPPRRSPACCPCNLRSRLGASGEGRQSRPRPAPHGRCGPARRRGDGRARGRCRAAQGKTPARPERLHLRQIPQVQGALVSLDPTTGRVLAMSGGWSFEQSQFNRATQADRQPGSSFKPIVYLTAMEKNISPSQRFLDAPYVVDLGAAGKWRPHNYENEFSGPSRCTWRWRSR